MPKRVEKPLVPRKARPGAPLDSTLYTRRGIRLRLDGFSDAEQREIFCVFRATVDEAHALALRQGTKVSLFTNQLRQLSPIRAVQGASSEQRKQDAIEIIERARRWIRGAALENTPLGLYLENHVFARHDVTAAIRTSRALGVAPSTGGARVGAPGVPLVGAVRGRAKREVRGEVGLGAASKDDRDVRMSRINRPRHNGTRRFDGARADHVRRDPQTS